MSTESDQMQTSTFAARRVRDEIFSLLQRRATEIAQIKS